MARAERLAADDALQQARSSGQTPAKTHLSFLMGHLELADGHLTEARAALHEAWTGILAEGRPDGIAAIGTVYGQALAMAEDKEGAIAVLNEAAAAWEKIGQEERAEEVRALAGGLGDSS